MSLCVALSPVIIPVFLFRTCERRLLYLGLVQEYRANGWCAVVCLSMQVHVNVSDLILVCINVPGKHSVIPETCKLLCLLLCLFIWLQWLRYHGNSTQLWRGHFLPHAPCPLQRTKWSDPVWCCKCLLTQVNKKHFFGRSFSIIVKIEQSTNFKQFKWIDKLHGLNKWAVMWCNI